MDGRDRSTWFAGDLGDPWVVSIAEGLPRPAFRIDCPGELPEDWPVDLPSPSVLVLHRSTLTTTDAQRLARLRSRSDPAPRVVLCVGAHARYHELERWSRLVDVAIPEATARETVSRHAFGAERRARPPDDPRPKITIVGANRDLRATLAEGARAGGFDAGAVAEPEEASSGVASAWDVPVLEPDWPGRLAGLADRAPVVALLGFADRATVRTARGHGASACLDLPCDVVDLLLLFDRLTMPRRSDPAHDLPPNPFGPRAARRVAGSS